MSEIEFKFTEEHKGLDFFIDEDGLPAFAKTTKKEKILELLEHNKCFLVMNEDFHKIEGDDTKEYLFYQDFLEYAWNKRYLKFVLNQKEITKFYLGKESWVFLATTERQNLAYLIAPCNFDWFEPDKKPQKHTCMTCNSIIYEGKITWIVSEFKLTKRPYCNNICLKNDQNLEDF